MNRIHPLAHSIQAILAGASFIVTPALVPEVIRACVQQKVPVMPGALTPTEILTAWQMGATLVKVFPADQLGPAHIRAVKAPFPEIPLMPTGGVTVETLPEFRKAGADAFGVGGPLFDPKQAAASNWDWFRIQATRFADAFRAGWVPSERAYMVTETLLAEAGQGRTHMIWRALHWTEETMKEHEAMGFEAGWGAAAAQLEALAKSL